MSFNKLYLDEEVFLEMYHNDDINKLLRTDSIIFLDSKSSKYFTLLKHGKLVELNKLIQKNDKKNKK
jgi:hypothetical protein